MPSTIADLPNEILTEIFQYALSKVPMKPINLNRVILVCKHWYELIISDSRLWCHIYLDRRIWTDVCLKRSKNSNLTVKTSHYLYQNAAQLIEPLMSETNRIEHLDLSFSVKAASQSIGKLLENRFPSLRSLSLDAINLLDVTTLPTSCFLFHSPSLSRHLTRLELVCLGLPSFPLPIPQVTNLTLRRPSWQTSCLALVTTLSSFPHLKRLELDGLSPSLDEVPATAAQLPRLSELEVRDQNPESCAALLDVINFPSPVVPMIHCNGSSSTSLAPLSRKCPYVCDLSPARLLIYQLYVSHDIYNQKYYPSLSARTQALPFKDCLKYFQSDDPPELQDPDVLVSLKPVVMKNFCDHLDLRQLDRLILSADTDFQYEYLPQLQNVKELALFGRFLPFLRLLEPQTSTSGTIPFPRLDTILINQGMSDAIATELAGILTRREREGHKVRRLHTSAGSTSADCCRLLEARLEVFWLDRKSPSFPLAPKTIPSPICSSQPSTSDAPETQFSVSKARPSDSIHGVGHLPSCSSPPNTQDTSEVQSVEADQPSDEINPTEPLDSNCSLGSNLVDARKNPPPNQTQPSAFSLASLPSPDVVERVPSPQNSPILSLLSLILRYKFLLYYLLSSIIGNILYRHGHPVCIFLAFLSNLVFTVLCLLSFDTMSFNVLQRP